jgi:hypothetical protein
MCSGACVRACVRACVIQHGGSLLQVCVAVCRVAHCLGKGLWATGHTATRPSSHLAPCRVDTIALPPSTHSRGDALRAAMTAAAQGNAAAPSAAYLLASMFNHSCEPNVDVTSPRNNAVAAFRAARPIEAGEQLYISYIDQDGELAERQAELEFGYGFKCSCPRCREGW